MTEFSSAGAVSQAGTPRSASGLARAGAWGAVAAALAFSAGLALWQTDRSAESAPSGDEALLSALQSLDLKSEDFAIVAQLGEVLEAELTANNALWQEPK